jgi:hypothetical protein
LVSHPGAIDVTAKKGTVTLSGPIVEAEVEQLLKGVRAVAGVTAIENRLEPHPGRRTRVGAARTRSARSAADACAMEAMESNCTRDRRRGGCCAGGALVAEGPVRGAATGIAGVELLERALWGTHAGA